MVRFSERRFKKLVFSLAKPTNLTFDNHALAALREHVVPSSSDLSSLDFNVEELRARLRPLISKLPPNTKVTRTILRRLLRKIEADRRVSLLASTSSSSSSTVSLRHRLLPPRVDVEEHFSALTARFNFLSSCLTRSSAPTLSSRQMQSPLASLKSPLKTGERLLVLCSEDGRRSANATPEFETFEQHELSDELRAALPHFQRDSIECLLQGSFYYANVARRTLSHVPFRDSVRLDDDLMQVDADDSDSDSDDSEDSIYNILLLRGIQLDAASQSQTSESIFSRLTSLVSLLEPHNIRLVVLFGPLTTPSTLPGPGRLLLLRRLSRIFAALSCDVVLVPSFTGPECATSEGVFPVFGDVDSSSSNFGGMTIGSNPMRIRIEREERKGGGLGDSNDEVEIKRWNVGFVGYEFMMGNASPDCLARTLYSNGCHLLPTLDTVYPRFEHCLRMPLTKETFASIVVIADRSMREFQRRIKGCLYVNVPNFEENGKFVLLNPMKKGGGEALFSSMQ